jgi:hypothetical protein
MAPDGPLYGRSILALSDTPYFAYYAEVCIEGCMVDHIIRYFPSCRRADLQHGVPRDLREVGDREVPDLRTRRAMKKVSGCL